MPSRDLQQDLRLQALEQEMFKQNMRERNRQRNEFLGANGLPLQNREATKRGAYFKIQFDGGKVVRNTADEGEGDGETFGARPRSEAHTPRRSADRQECPEFGI